MNGFLQLLRESRVEALAAIQISDLAPLLLPLLVTAMLAFVVSLVWLNKRRLHARMIFEMDENLDTPRSHWPGPPQFQSSMFEFPCRWLAVRSNDPQEVQNALNLTNATSCSWEEGLAEARERKLFISPPIGEWILVMGSGLPEPAEDVDQCFRFLAGLSRKLGHVQFFSANRVLLHHAWAQIETGRVIRAYAWAGQTQWNQGKKTSGEIQLRLKCFDYCESAGKASYDHNEAFSNNTEKVPLLAAKWSVDPTAIEEKHFKAGHGIAGELSSKPY